MVSRCCGVRLQSSWPLGAQGHANQEGQRPPDIARSLSFWRGAQPLGQALCRVFVSLGDSSHSQSQRPAHVARKLPSTRAASGGFLPGSARVRPSASPASLLYSSQAALAPRQSTVCLSSCMPPHVASTSSQRASRSIGTIELLAFVSLNHVYGAIDTVIAPGSLAANTLLLLNLHHGQKSWFSHGFPDT
jgi:hypothetical protein